MTPEFWLQLVRTLCVIVGAVAAAVAVAKYRSEKKGERKQRWQKACVQSILQNVEDRIGFLQLQEKYRSQAASEMNKILGSKDISEEALRLILIDLCADNVIVQLGQDTYSLTTYPGQIEKSQKQNAEMLDLQKLFFDAQLESLSKQDERLGEMIDQNRKILGVSSMDSLHLTPIGK